MKGEIMEINSVSKGSYLPEKDVSKLQEKEKLDHYPKPQKIQASTNIQSREDKKDLKEKDDPQKESQGDPSLELISKKQEDRILQSSQSSTTDSAAGSQRIKDQIHLSQRGIHKDSSQDREQAVQEFQRSNIVAKSDNLEKRISIAEELAHKVRKAKTATTAEDKSENRSAAIEKLSEYAKENNKAPILESKAVAIEHEEPIRFSEKSNEKEKPKPKQEEQDEKVEFKPVKGTNFYHAIKAYQSTQDQASTPKKSEDYQQTATNYAAEKMKPTQELQYATQQIEFTTTASHDDKNEEYNKVFLKPNKSVVTQDDNIEHEQQFTESQKTKVNETKHEVELKQEELDTKQLENVKVAEKELAKIEQQLSEQVQTLASEIPPPDEPVVVKSKPEADKENKILDKTIQEIRYERKTVEHIKKVYSEPIHQNEAGAKKYDTHQSLEQMEQLANKTSSEITQDHQFSMQNGFKPETVIQLLT